jgi:short-subunit dehydrogenase
MTGKNGGDVVVVTGASSGIGRATALRFAREAALLVLAARREQALQDVARECQGIPAAGRTLVVPTDVADAKAVDDLARRAAAEFGRIDVWVNNAGVTLFARLDQAPPEDYRRVIEVNLLGTINGARAVLPRFREQGRGVLINVASVYGKVGGPYLGAYAASKFGVVGFSEALRQELIGERHIRVCTVMPASIDTPLFQHAGNYTGRAVKPLRPVYDAEIVAKAIVTCAKHPKREVFVGGAGRVLYQQRLMGRGMFERTHARLVDHDHFEQRSAEPSSGNLYEPMLEWTSVSGQWPSSPRPPVRRLFAATLLSAGALAVVSRRRRSS